MGKKKLSLDFIRYSFTEDGYILLTTNYKNSSQKLEYICPVGHRHRISWDNWKQGHRCPYCAGQGKPSLDYIRKLFNEDGYKLLTKEYINDRQKLSYVCSFGHKHAMRWGNWRSGRRCPSCKAIKHSKIYSGSGHHNWKGGITEFNKELRNFVRSIGWTEQIFKRDNYTCLRCGKRGGHLVAHHIISLSCIREFFNINTIEDAKKCDVLYDINNGATLCEMCHKTHHEELRGGLLKCQKDLMVLSNGLYKPFVMETLHRNFLNCWEPLTDDAEGNQQRSLEKGTFNDQSQDVGPSGLKQEGSYMDFDMV